MSRKSGLSGLILVASLFLVGCADKEQILCDSRIEEASKAGYREAVEAIQLQNLQDIRGDQLACRAYEKLPAQLQNLAGLDCSQKWPSNIENLSASIPLAPSLILFLLLLLAFGFWYFVFPSFGQFAGSAGAAFALKIDPLKARILAEIHAEKTNLKSQLKPLHQEINELRASSKTAEAEAADAKNRAAVAKEELDDLHDQADALRVEIERRLALSKKAASTADLADLLGSIGKKPSK